MAGIVNLSISVIEGYAGLYKVEVRGSGFIPNQIVFWHLRGEDPEFDDIIKAPSGSGPVNPDGTFYFTATAMGVSLNEDFGGEDEIYADVSYYGGSHHRSNTVRRNF